MKKNTLFKICFCMFIPTICSTFMYSDSTALKNFFLGKEKFINYDSINLSTGTMNYGIKGKDAEVILDPVTQQAGLRVYYQTSYFNIVFSEAERTKIIKSIDKYYNDFDNHVLIKKQTSKTRKAYSSKGSCYIEWGLFKAMMDNLGYPRYTIGYEFKKVKEKTSPYFCIIIWGCKNESQDFGDTKAKESVEIQLYFTRAQAKKLVEVLSQDIINEKISEYDSFIETSTSDSEEYYEEDEFDNTSLKNNTQSSSEKASSEKVEESSEFIPESADVEADDEETTIE